MAEPLLEQYDVRGGQPETPAGSLSGGNQQKVRDRARARRGAAGHDRRAADARPGRRRDRVRPPAAARAARRRPRRAARLARAGGDPLAGRPRARDLRGPDRRRAPAGRDRRGARRRDDGGGKAVRRDADPSGSGPGTGRARSPSPRGCRATCAAAASWCRSSPRCWPSSSAASSIALAGANPLDTYKAIFEGSGLNWLFPWVTGDDRMLAALNLQQTLILTGAADPHRPRGRVRLPRRPVQHRRPGPVPRRQLSAPSTSARRSTGMPGLLHVVARDRRRRVVGGARGRGIAGFLKATTGANEVISTIMLNWTALYIGLYLFGIGGPLHTRDPAQRVDPGLQRHRRGRAAAGLLGRPGAAGPAHRHLHRARRRRRCSGCCSTAR